MSIDNQPSLEPSYIEDRPSEVYDGDPFAIPSEFTDVVGSFENPLQPQEPTREYLAVYDGDQEISIPKTGRVTLTSKAGTKLELDVKELEKAAWSQKEAPRLLNEKNLLQKEYQTYKDKYSDLETILQTEDLKGPMWAAHALGSLYRLNPDRQADITAFINAIREDRLDAHDVRESELKREEINLKKQKQEIQAGQFSSELYSYSTELQHQLEESTGVSGDVVDLTVSNLLEAGIISVIDDTAPPETQRRQLEYNTAVIHADLLGSRARRVCQGLGLSEDDIRQNAQSISGFLTANPSASEEILARQLGAFFGKAQQAPNIAQERIQAYRQPQGRRPEITSPKPISPHRTKPGKAPMEDYFREHYGL